MIYIFQTDTSMTGNLKFQRHDCAEKLGDGYCVRSPFNDGFGILIVFDDSNGVPRLIHGGYWWNDLLRISPELLPEVYIDKDGRMVRRDGTVIFDVEEGK